MVLTSSLFNSNRLVSSISAAALAVGLAFFAQPTQKASAQVALQGSGATSIEPLVPTWFTANGVNYNPVGSGAGRTDFQNGVTDFVASDLTLPNVDGQVAINVVNIPVSFPYNVPGFSASLTTPQACGIISGSITNWSDLGGPDLPITFVFRSDSSGTTGILNTFVTNNCGFSVPPFPVGFGASGSDGIISTVQFTEGAIGYVDTPAAVQSGVPIASLDTTIEGPNYIVFRGSYGDPQTAAAATSLCQYLTGPDAATAAANLGYSVQANDPSVCNAIQSGS